MFAHLFFEAQQGGGVLFLLDVALKDSEAIRTFVNITNQYPFPISLRQGHYCIDAKSLMGIFSLDLAKPITVEAYGTQASVLNDDLRKFAV